MKIIRVENCGKCPYRKHINLRYSAQVDFEYCGGFYAHTTNPLDWPIKNVTEIPEWCPLEDENAER